MKYLLTIYILTLPFILFSQVGKVTGYIYDCEEKGIVPFAQVKFHSLDTTIMANSSGKFTAELQPGTYMVYAEKVLFNIDKVEQSAFAMGNNFKSYKEVIIKSDRTTDASFILTNRIDKNKRCVKQFHKIHSRLVATKPKTN
jgi:hypothetical protein